MTNGSLITNNGWKILLNRAYKASPDYTAPTIFRVGISNDTPAATDTALDKQIPITGTEAVDACDATTGWTAGTDSAVALNTSRFVEGTGSLSVAKTGTTGTVFSISKTTTSRDFTSKDFWAFVYITALSDLVATGTAITIRFGSDASNYYYYNVAIGDLSTGWNAITFNSSTASGTTGTPTIAACDYTAVLFNVDSTSDTVAADRILVDDMKVASADDYKKTFEASYPSIDETNMEVTIRGKLLTTQSNGYNVNAFSLWNTDGTPMLHSLDVFTAESKSDTDEFIFEVVDRKTT